MRLLIPGSVQFGLYLSTPPTSGVAAVAPPAAQPPAADLRGPPVPGSPWFSLAASPAAPPVAPVVPASSPQAKPFLSRFVHESEDRRLARITEHLMILVNSLVAQGIVRQTGPSSFTIVPPSTGVVSSFDGRTGAVTLTSGDIVSALGYRPAQPLAMGQGVAAGQANSVLYLDSTATLAQKNPGLTYDGNTFTVSIGGIGASTAQASALTAINPTPATVTSQNQNTPGVTWSGQAWHTTNNVSRQIDFRIYAFCDPGSPPLGVWRFDGQVAGGGYVTLMDLRTAGLFSFFSPGGLGSNASFNLSANAQLILNQGAAGTASSVVFQHNSATEGTIQTASGVMVFATVAGAVRFLMNGSAEGLFIDTAGLVGLNKVSPGAKLHIVTPAAGTKGLIVQGTASQTATLAQFLGVSSTSAVREMVEIDAAWGDPTDATRYAEFAVRVWDTAVKAAIQVKLTGTSLGRGALGANTTGSYNTALGSRAMETNTTGDTNTAVGYAALALNTSGINNAAFGQQACYNCMTGQNNVGFGPGALHELTASSNNIGIGASALYNVNADGNVGIGHLAGYGLAAVTYCVFIGYQAGYSSWSADSITEATCLGFRTGASGNYGTAIGAEAIAAANETAFSPYSSSQTGYCYSSTSALRPRADIVDSAVDNTDATRKYRRVFRAYDTAAREGLRIEGDGTQALVSLYGVAAVARQTASADATDLASVITLANNLKAILKNIGIAQ